MKNITKILTFTVLIINLFFTFNYNARAIESNSNANYDTTTISCGSVKGIPKGITIFSRNLIKVIKVLVPVVLIILGIIDMVRAVSGNDEKVMKEASSRLIKRAIAAVLVFFVISLVQFVINVLSKAAKDSGKSDGDDPTNGIVECISCFISDASYCVEDGYFDEDKNLD